MLLPRFVELALAGILVDESGRSGKADAEHVAAAVAVEVVLGDLLKPDLDPAALDSANEKPARAQIVDVDRAAVEGDAGGRDPDHRGLHVEVGDLDAVAGQEIGDPVAVEAGRRVPEAIDVGPAGHDVDARAAGENVVTRTAVHRVVAVISRQLVVAA